MVEGVGDWGCVHSQCAFQTKLLQNKLRHVTGVQDTKFSRLDILDDLNLTVRERCLLGILGKRDFHDILRLENQVVRPCQGTQHVLGVLVSQIPTIPIMSCVIHQDEALVCCRHRG